MTENEKKVNEEIEQDQAQAPVAADETKKEESPATETAEVEAEATPEAETEKVEEATKAEAETTEAVAESEEAVAPEEVPAKKASHREKAIPAEPGDFDWDNVGKKREVYSKNEREKLEQMYDKTLNSIGDHEVIDGFVVSKNSREVVVNIGFKSDGVIPVNEFRYNPNLKVGDKVEVYVENQVSCWAQMMFLFRNSICFRGGFTL